MKWTALLVIGAVILISIVDLGANVVSLIPGLGDIAETASEILLEGLQIVIVAGYILLNRGE